MSSSQAGQEIRISPKSGRRSIERILGGILIFAFCKGHHGRANAGLGRRPPVDLFFCFRLGLHRAGKRTFRSAPPFASFLFNKNTRLGCKSRALWHERGTQKIRIWGIGMW